jgi:hypothetical protein
MVDSPGFDREHSRQQDQLVADVKILQKVNAVHRDAFMLKYPGQVQHCLRLTMERLQFGLDKRDGVLLADSSTWRMSTAELADLADCAHKLNDILKGF